MNKWASGVGKAFRNLLKFRGLIILGVLMIPVIMGFFALRHHLAGPPAVKDAPWEVETYIYQNGIKQPAHTFYGQQYSTVNGTPTLLVYWEWNGKKYVKHTATKAFPQAQWGAVDIIKRPGQ